ELPNCQFVTACYGVVDTAKGVATFARGGHPHPVHVRTDGTCEEAKTIGGLLGIMPNEAFPAPSVRLDYGEKLIVYSDGLEDAIVAKKDRTGGDNCFTERFLEIAKLPALKFLNELGTDLDHSEGSLQQLDDQSCLVIERIKAGR